MASIDAALSLPDLRIGEYSIDGIEQILTPALVVYPEIVDSNIKATLRQLGGDANRWRPHVKTAKLAFIMRRLVANGILNFKCATTLELATAAEAGARDVLVAYPLIGAGARRVQEIARLFPATQVSALVESREQIDAWAGSPIGLFIDVNPGMDRTGIEQGRVDEIVELARAVESAGQRFRGLHYYDGQLSGQPMAERQEVAHRGYDRLIEIVESLSRAGIAVEEVITAGTPAFPCTVSYARFGEAGFVHRASPGTVVYGDCTSLTQLPDAWGYRPAAIVVSTVVSHPSPNRVTCDAGHKTVSADSGVPTCRVIGRPDLLPAKPSEEHLPIDRGGGAALPEIGEPLYLVPRHVCPTVNNFDHALIVVSGRVIGVERVTARGREAPFALA